MLLLTLLLLEPAAFVPGVVVVEAELEQLLGILPPIESVVFCIAITLLGVLLVLRFAIGTLVSVLLLLLLLVLWPLVLLVDVPVRIVAVCATTEEAFIAEKDSFLRDSSPDLSY